MVVLNARWVDWAGVAWRERERERVEQETAPHPLVEKLGPRDAIYNTESRATRARILCVCVRPRERKKRGPESPVVVYSRYSTASVTRRCICTKAAKALINKYRPTEET